MSTVCTAASLAPGGTTRLAPRHMPSPALPSLRALWGNLGIGARAREPNKRFGAVRGSNLAASVADSAGSMGAGV
eukprot:13855758-Alexandrium_andersonii.AAC.1